MKALHYLPLLEVRNSIPLEDVVECIYQAWLPAIGILYGKQQAIRIINTLLETDNSELAFTNIKVMIADSKLAGLTVSLPLQNLHGIRQIDFYCILKLAENKKVFLEKMKIFNELFSPPQGMGTYLSKFGVPLSLHGLGYGKRLLEAFIADEKKKGIQQIFLEVSPLNISAIHLYKNYGFQQVRNKNQKERQDQYLWFTLAMESI